ncbi:MAG: carboxypeptidase-like regulatory domain-containing protein, partial [Proteobacteria bacterium]|nr:carboxypeptidase-like regulatory domain-containing protein [Pseudomonadota bacterium]
MFSRQETRSIAASIFVAAAVAGVALVPIIMPASAQTVAIDNNDIGGVVSGPNGPEAGVWVIAETRDLGTRYIKAVVTDDQGRYVVPDLPSANYDIWVRGYGLVDSPKLRSGPGKILNLSAVPAPNAATAAQYYPAIHWYSMMKLPAKSDFG